MTAAGVSAVRCPVCDASLKDGDRFCESCGTALTGVSDASTTGAGPRVPPCPECGSGAFTDGYCDTCGAARRRPEEHVVEHPVPWVAALSDRGRRRRRNEDSVAVAAGPERGSRVVLVVCDGVSTSRDGDLASRAAAGAARDALAGSAPPVDPSTWESLLEQACAAATVAVVDVTRGDGANDAPSTTLVAGVVVDGLFVAGSVGDSRAYWVPDDGPATVLTADDSWATDRIEAGLTPAQAEQLPDAHVITRWIGSDSPGHTPRTGAVGVSTAGWAVLCSDGLWNYCSPADDLARLVRLASDEHDQQALAVASRLVSWANEQGGHDNISVALARVVPPGPREAAGTPAA